MRATRRDTFWARLPQARNATREQPRLLAQETDRQPGTRPARHSNTAPAGLASAAHLGTRIGAEAGGATDRALAAGFASVTAGRIGPAASEATPRREFGAPARTKIERARFVSVCYYRVASRSRNGTQHDSIPVQPVARPMPAIGGAIPSTPNPRRPARRHPCIVPM